MLSVMLFLTGMMSSIFHSEDSEDEPFDPQPPSRERERSHSKTKKNRRERRHVDRDSESTEPASVLQPQKGAEPETQVNTGGTTINLQSAI